MKADPELMRQAVYDLARHKLQEQLVDSNPTDTKCAERALEAAIHGVEEFSRQQVSLPALSSVPLLSSAFSRNPPRAEAGPAPSGSDLVELIHRANGADRLPLWAVMTAAVLLTVGTVFIVVPQRDRLMTLGRPLGDQREQTVPEKAVGTPASPTALNRSPPPPSFPRPTDYGVYALGDDALTELRLLPGRAPDARVAISAAFRLPGKVSLPNGHPEFIVFRRETTTNILEHAEVRVIARIAREFSAESAGKRIDDNDSWVIRNFSYPYRSSPVPDNPEMYRLHSEDPTLQLSPGQYALILKDQSYYFSVGGAIVDPRQCIERVIATSGTFYSACKKRNHAL
ncbi:hypothetical protein [Bradyrhizobium cytisi]|uniref:hypothetical protein n=1 Tax=Bradyrhizobium cytisi TaxID=515489 RepID=UPI001652BD2C|nr:hypothetical protein [Bradyrhizobium cytisi]